MISTVQDITEQKRVEAEIKKLETLNRQLLKSESLGRMAGAIAHHFNNQLTVVMGNLELALENLPGNAETRENLIEAMQAARRSSDISGWMLTYLGQGAGIREPMDLSEACRKNLPMLRDAVPKNIALETDLMASGPVVRANLNQMRQVLTHLVINGAEAMGDCNGRVRLSVRTIPAPDISQGYTAPMDWKADADSYACLEVTDTGCGISSRNMENIFDPFFTTKFTGRGIGLAVVLGIVKAWDGAIRVETAKDHGSTFRVLLPLITDKVPRKSGKAAEVHKAAEGGDVLIVEDQDSLRKLAQTMLKRLGFSARAAAGGTEALELFHQHRGTIRCVITDLTMPGMDGWAILEALRKIQPALPVILSSAYDEAQAMGHDDSERPNAFLHKPYTMDELKETLCRVLPDEA